MDKSLGIYQREEAFVHSCDNQYILDLTQRTILLSLSHW